MISPSNDPLEPFGDEGQYLGFLHDSEVPPIDLRNAMTQVVELAKDTTAARTEIHWQVAATLVYVIDSINNLMISQAREIADQKKLIAQMQLDQALALKTDDETGH